MAKKIKPLVHFDASYYKYPTSICRGFWGVYPLETGLSSRNIKRRTEWLEAVTVRAKSDFNMMINESYAIPSDIELLECLLEKHGIFLNPFFRRKIRKRVVGKFAEAPIDLAKFEKAFSEAWGYKCRLNNKENIIFNIINHIFEQNIFKIINDPLKYQKLNNWFKKFEPPQTCIICNNNFRVIDLPDWIYFGSNGFNSCCFQCQILQSPRKIELNNLVPAFIESCGFIPCSDANPINYAFTSRLTESKWPKAIQAYIKMGGIDHVKEKFGSWFEALAKTGALPDGVLTTSRGIRCLAQDGHVCHSLDEQHIDNWLFAHGISHEREPHYPVHSTLNPKGGRRADWKVGDKFIEYFGLVGDQNYEKKMDEKITLTKKLNIELIAIYPQDIDNLDHLLHVLLNQSYL